jgi:molecular chaperone HscB
MRYYEVLGLEPQLSIDAADLQARFYRASREWHPDRFTRASTEEQQKALDMTALINDAFRTLKAPVARAEYFLDQHQVPATKAVPPELLAEVFELNMALEELREGDESARPALAQARDKFVSMLGEIDHGLSAIFIRYDAGRHDESLLLAARSLLDRRRYVANLIRDVDKELNPNVHLSN